MGRPAKRWNVGCEQLTAKECADRVGVSVESLKKRLSRCGGDMEKAMSYYENQKARTRRDNDAMVDQLVTAIMGEEEADGGPMELSDVWADQQETTPEGAIIGGDEAEQASEDEIEDPKLASLRRYNGAIAGLTGLMDVDCESIEMCDMLVKCLGALRGARCRKFDDLVDWDAIAKGRCAR